ncbi:MAG: hypothetical protein ABWY13_05560 [Mesorhizobium sp.]|jgi:hypothetical protein
MQTETELEMVHRHIREGFAGIARQRQIIASLREAGESTDVAERLLALYERVQLCHEMHLVRLEAGQVSRIFATA